MKKLIEYKDLPASAKHDHDYLYDCSNGDWSGEALFYLQDDGLLVGCFPPEAGCRGDWHKRVFEVEPDGHGFWT